MVVILPVYLKFVEIAKSRLVSNVTMETLLTTMMVVRQLVKFKKFVEMDC